MTCEMCGKITEYNFVINIYDESKVRTMHICESCLNKLSISESLGEITFTILRSKEKGVIKCVINKVIS